MEASLTEDALSERPPLRTNRLAALAIAEGFPLAERVTM